MSSVANITAVLEGSVAREAAGLAREEQLHTMLRGAFGAIRVYEDALLALAAEQGYLRRQEIAEKVSGRVSVLLDPSTDRTGAPLQAVPELEPASDAEIRTLIGSPLVSDDALDAALGEGRR